MVLTLALAAALALPGGRYAAHARHPDRQCTGKCLPDQRRHRRGAVDQNSGQRCVASLTKMMTALLLLESGKNLDETITVPADLTEEA